MVSQRILPGLVLAVVAGMAVAQPDGALRWRRTPSLGLQAGETDTRLPCFSYTLSCTDATNVSLYSSPRASRSLGMQVSANEASSGSPVTRMPGFSVSLVGKAGIAPKLGVYGRVGTTLNRSPTRFMGTGGPEGGLTYGVGLSWDLTRTASASMGLDSFDTRTTFGDSRDLRTSLGLQWRY